jgi:hypothetical protein
MWKHDKSAYKLYKSAQLHMRFSERLPFAVWGLVGGLVGLAALGWFLKGRLAERFNPTHNAAPASAQVDSKASGGPVAAQTGGGQGIDARTVGKGRWPVYDAEPYRREREPLAGRAVQWEGGYTEGKTTVTFFGLYVEEERVATVTLDQVLRMGYIWKSWGPCVGSLRFGPVERLVTCGKRVEPRDGGAGGVPPVSASGVERQGAV